MGLSEIDLMLFNLKWAADGAGITKRPDAETQAFARGVRAGLDDAIAWIERWSTDHVPTCEGEST